MVFLEFCDLIEFMLLAIRFIHYQRSWNPSSCECVDYRQNTYDRDFGLSVKASSSVALERTGYDIRVI